MTLPVLLTTLVGRQAELTALRSVLGEQRLVTVMGPPGGGKTRLVLELCRQIAGSLRLAYCDLTAALDAEGICATLARSLGAVEIDGSARLSEVLASRGPLVVVLDNFEQVASHAPTTLGQWRRECPDARFLVTSRERLGLQGEYIFELPPLGLPSEDGDGQDSDAVRLFLDRARAAGGSTALAFDRRAVIDLVRGLEGNPLAIELAAGMVRVMTPAQIASMRLEGPAAHGAWAPLSSAIDRSWRLLAAAEQEALAQMSVFRGGFDAKAVRGVTGAAAPLELLQSLRDKSMVFAQETMSPPRELRFGLYVAIREYAWQKLNEMGLVARAQEGHARWILDASREWLDRIAVQDDALSMERLARETENLMVVYREAMSQGQATTALTAACALDTALMRSAPWIERESVLGSAIDLAGQVGAERSALADALLRRAEIAFLHRQAGAGEDDGRRALVLAGEINDRQLRVQSHTLLGRVADGGGDFGAARRFLRAAIDEIEIDKEPLLHGRALRFLGWTSYHEGRLSDARAYYERSLVVFSATGGALLHTERLRYALAVVLVDQGDLIGARAQLEDVVESFRRHGDALPEAMAASLLGNIALEDGRFDEAVPRFEQACTRCADIGARRKAIAPQTYLAVCHFGANRPVDARRAIDLALASARTYADRPWELIALAFSGAMLAGADLLEAAEASFDQAAQHGPQASFFGARLIDLCRGFCDVARARQAMAQGNLPVVPRSLAAARARLAAQGERREWQVVRIARGVLERAIAEATTSLRQEAVGNDLVVGRGGGWFQVPGGQRVSLVRRRISMQILARLVEARISGPGSVVLSRDILDAVWPDESIPPELAAGRLYTAVAELRKLGLGAVLMSGAGGYLLDPAVSLREED